MFPIRRKPRLNELEQITGIERSVPRSATRTDISKLERKILGRNWGQPRKKMEGWPK